MQRERVRPGFVGTATDNGKPVLLLPGQHLYNNANFSLLEIKSVSESWISCGPLHLIRVSQGYLGLPSINKRPVLLESGMHFIFDPGFEMKKAPPSSGAPFTSVNDVYITNGPISIIRVTPGNIGLATSSKQPVLLGAGLRARGLRAHAHRLRRSGGTGRRHRRDDEGASATGPRAA